MADRTLRGSRLGAVSYETDYGIDVAARAFTERELGQSKMSGSNIREAILKVAEWGIRGRLDRARGVVR